MTSSHLRTKVDLASKISCIPIGRYPA